MSSGNGISNSSKKALTKWGPIGGAAVVLLVLAVAGLSRVGCSNHHTPPGQVGYIKSKPIVGAGAFVGTQVGPTSTGWVWRQEVQNVDIRPRTYSEEMSILTSEGARLKFIAHARIRLNKDKIRDVVEKLGGEGWYDANVKKQFSSVVRDIVQQLEPFEVKSEMRKIGDQALIAMKERYKDSPIEFLTVDIGNIEYPQTVVEQVVRKFVTKEDNERKDIELKIAQIQIKIGTEEARGVADAQQIIRTTLDPMLLQLDALRAIEKLAGSVNTTFLVTPFSKNGSAPIIMSIDK